MCARRVGLGHGRCHGGRAGRNAVQHVMFGFQCVWHVCVFFGLLNCLSVLQTDYMVGALNAHTTCGTCRMRRSNMPHTHAQHAAEHGAIVSGFVRSLSLSFELGWLARVCARHKRPEAECTPTALATAATASATRAEQSARCGRQVCVERSQKERRCQQNAFLLTSTAVEGRRRRGDNLD